MAPWPQRLNNNPTTGNGHTTPVHTDVHRPVALPTSNAPDYEIPTLRRRPPQNTADTDPLKHSRSFSHPFPSIFGGGKKSDKRSLIRPDANIFDSTDDDASTNGDGARPNGSSKPPVRNTSQKTSQEPMTGKCMTCDSTVRWPQGLKVYRCTICLTINDLEPYADTRDGAAGPDAMASAAGHRKPLALSVDKTHSIIEHSVVQFLESLLDENLSPPKVSQASPPPSPIFNDDDAPEGLLFSQVQDSYLSPPSPSKATRSPGQPSYQRPTLGTRSPSDPSLSPYNHGRGGENSLLRRCPVNPGLQRPRTAVALPPDRPFFATREQGVSEDEMVSKQHSSSSNAIFRPLESYIAGCFTGCATLNASFFTVRPQRNVKDRSISVEQLEKPAFDSRQLPNPEANAPLSEVDAKTLLLGDFAENGFWWTGNRLDHSRTDHELRRPKSPESWKGVVTQKTPRINWAEAGEWYRLVTYAGHDWRKTWKAMCPNGTDSASIARRTRWESVSVELIDRHITESRLHAQRALLKSSENLLKRPRRPLRNAEDCRFLLILLANPLLSPSYSTASENGRSVKEVSLLSPKLPQPRAAAPTSPTRRPLPTPLKKSSGPGHHSGIVKRVLGLISNLSNEVHQFLISWFARTSDAYVQRLVELVGSFVTYRLSRQHSRKRSEYINPTDGLVPSFADAGVRHPSQLHAALDVRSVSTRSKSTDNKPKLAIYGDDWQVRAASRVMALLFTANIGHSSRKRETLPLDQRTPSAGLNAKHQAQAHGQLIPISSFYNTMLDYADLVSDFETWESNRGKFSFCQYPFFLSIWAKIHILEHDARRQMEGKAREAFFDSILSHKAVSQYLVLKVRRDCLVEDSLRGVSEVIGSGGEEIKKGLRIDFVGEEGVDAGGLRKEWFLLLVREIFDPHHGLFVYDEDSHFCYFNPFCFESSEQFFLVGVLLGLAIYNSTILDVAFPPFVFKKMLASAPSTAVPTTSSPRLTHGYTLEDLAEYKPALANGLRQLLEFEGNVQEIFCRDFVAEVDRYGDIVQIPLCSNGENRPVTNANRREFVDLYTQYLLDSAVTRQYEPFKRGFFTVCGGNALSLFRPEEIELLVRGSDEPLDISSLRAVAVYEGWPDGNKEPEKQPQVRWFWDFFTRASPAEQRKILSFITGSDRIPAMGATNLVIRVLLVKDTKTLAIGDSERFPSARTCFNQLLLHAYSSRKKLEEKLGTAVSESEGFGLK